LDGAIIVGEEELRVKGTNEILMDVRLDIRELNTKMDGLKDLTKKVDEVYISSSRATQSTESAHKRIDRVDKIIFWAGTTIIGGLVVAALTLFLKSKGV
jgi:uncharacterized protein YoxC